MSHYAAGFHRIFKWTDPVGANIDHGKADLIGDALDNKGPTPPPGPPNPNDAANAAQATTDAMRQRRGMMANLYAGSNQNSAPVTGKTMLGS